MKQFIKFNKIPEYIPSLTFDGDENDLRLWDDHNQIGFGAENEEKYQKAEKEIDDFEIKGKGWNIYLSYDVSGFDYWMNRMQESNDVHIIISFDKKTIPLDEVINIKNALNETYYKLSEIESEYDYLPDLK